VPSGHCLAILARSSTPLKRGLMVANGVGIVDPDYSGPNDEVMIQVLNITDGEVAIRRGDRLAQGIVLPAPQVIWEEVSSIREVARGGFGSTGH
jgi:dUTP pyrophosphatase